MKVSTEVRGKVLSEPHYNMLEEGSVYVCIRVSTTAKRTMKMIVPTTSWKICQVIFLLSHRNQVKVPAHLLESIFFF